MPTLPPIEDQAINVSKDLKVDSFSNYEVKKWLHFMLLNFTGSDGEEHEAEVVLEWIHDEGYFWDIRETTDDAIYEILSDLDDDVVELLHEEMAS